MAESIRWLFLPILVSLLLTPQTAGAVDPLDFTILKFQCEDSDGKVRMETVDKIRHKICQIGDQVIVSVENLEEWRADPEHSLEKLNLTLDGQVLAGRHPYPSDGKSQPGLNQELRFQLEPKQENAENMAAWKTLLTRTKLYKPEIVTIAIALEGTQERYSYQGSKIGLRVASLTRIWTVVILYFSLLAAFVWKVVSANLLRDLGPKPVEGKTPFSLGYTQMAFWFFLVIGGFLYTWLVTGDLAVLTPGVLGLVGISAATGLVATAVGTSKQTAVPAKQLALEQERTDLLGRLDSLQTEITAAVASASTSLSTLRAEQDLKNRRLAVVNSSIDDLTTVPKSLGFLQDILSSGGDVTLPRFQMMAWTLVLGLVFVHSVYTTLNMPEFDATLLGLMGLSSGTYVGFKIPSATAK